MTSRKSADPSPESIARANRQRLAQEEGARAMEEVARKDAAVRKNMERLRALRLAREAEQAGPPAGDASRAKTKKPGKKSAK